MLSRMQPAVTVVGSSEIPRPGLANARLADDGHNLSVTGASTLMRFVKRPTLRFSAYEAGSAGTRSRPGPQAAPPMPMSS